MSRPYFDRTPEFRSAVESAAFRISSASPASVQQPLLPRNEGANKGGQRSEFARMAAKIGKDIQGTTGKLEKLAQRRSSRRWPYSRRHCRMFELTIATRQSRNGKRSSTTDPSRSA